MKSLTLLLFIGLSLTVYSQAPQKYLLRLDWGNPPVHLKNQKFVLQGETDTFITNAQGELTISLVNNNTYSIVLLPSKVIVQLDTLNLQTSDTGITVTKNKIKSGATIFISVAGEKYRTLFGVQKAYQIDQNEIKKAACCTLSECFENSNTVEISNSDGVSGIKQIEMLGLPGKYVLMTSSNVHNVKIWNQLNGFSQIPGPLVNGIAVSKGVGSVTNSYSGITGGIDYQLKTYENSPKLFFNTYANNQQRFENNLFVKFKIGKKIENLTFLHHSIQNLIMDHNKDGFTDMPVLQRLYAGQNYSVEGEKAELKIHWNYLSENKYSGTLTNSNVLFNPQTFNDSTQYVFKQKTQRLEGSVKLGLFLNDAKTKSIGNIFNVYIQRDSLGFGYQKNIQANNSGIGYNGIFSAELNDNLDLRAGIQVTLDRAAEDISFLKSRFYLSINTEFVKGAYSELSYKRNRFTGLLGLRVDHSNIYGVFFTPRLHLKYEHSQLLSSFFQIGQGRKTPWIWSEMYPLLISGKKVNLPVPAPNPWNPVSMYFLQQENAWSSSLGFLKKGKLKGKKYTLSADANLTYFINMLVLDREANPNFINVKQQQDILNVSFQEDFSIELHKRVSFSLSHRYVENKATIGGKEILQPLYSPHRIVSALGLKNRKNWMLDLLLQINSPKRIPNGSIDLNNKELNNFSPWYSIFNLQLRKNVKEKVELYSGIENILNVRQHNLVRSATDFNSPYFDATAVWGPTNGRTVYIGLRWSVK